MLQLLSNSCGNILDDAKLTDTLKQARSTADAVKERLQQTAAVMLIVEEARAAYKPVAFRGSFLFFVVQELKKLNCMYTSSLDSFLEAFNTAIRDTQKQHQTEHMMHQVLQQQHEGTAARTGARQEAWIQTLVDAITLTVFTRTLTGLFEKHKLAFALAVAAEVLKREKYPASAEVPLETLNPMKQTLNTEPTLNRFGLMLSTLPPGKKASHLVIFLKPCTSSIL